MIITPTEHATNTGDAESVELLIREARRKARRRRLMIGSIIFTALIAGPLAIMVGGDLANSTRPTNHGERSQTTNLPTGRIVTLDVAGSLAVGPNGVLYTAAPDEHRILARLPDGKFKVVAGTETAGYSGNGEKAIDAELSDPIDLTFNSMVDLYFVDSGHVRVIKNDGVIETIVGDGSISWPLGSHPAATVADGAPALSASFRSDPSIAFGPGGILYIASDAQLLRLTSAGRLDTIRTHRVSFGKIVGLPVSLDEGLDTLAAAKDGSLYVSGFNGWAIWHVAPNGAATYVGYDRGSGGTIPDLVSDPRGAVYAANGGAIVRVTPTGVAKVDKLVKVDGKYFWATNFAFGPHGTLFVDELPGNLGFEPRQELVSLRGGRTRVLWTEPKSAAARHSQ